MFLEWRNVNGFSLSFVDAEKVRVLPGVGWRPLPCEELVGTWRNRPENKVARCITRGIAIKVGTSARIRSLRHQSDSRIGKGAHRGIENGPNDSAAVAADYNLNRAFDRPRDVQPGPENIF